MSAYKQLLTFLLVISYQCLVAQTPKMILPDLTNRQVVINKGSELLKAEKLATGNPSLMESDWNVVLRNLSSFNHTSQVPTIEFKKLKSMANEVRSTVPDRMNDIKNTPRSAVNTPILNRNFKGNARDQSVPMDNSMAVSRNGFIVSAINTNVIFTNPAGTITYQKAFSDFFTLLNLGTRMYDPRVIYDVEQNKFIFMCLNGSDPTTTQLCFAFSKTEDPNGEWHYYKVDGNPSGDNRWFDYPNVGVSKNDLYVAGLMRDIPGDWQYSVLYQLDKNAGFAGQDLTFKYYNELKNADNAPSFNLVPTPSAWDYLSGPGMYFVSNEALGGDTYNLYYTTGSLSDDPSLISLQTKGLATQLAPDGRQKNSPNVLNTFDSRIWSALYHNGTIHMGGHVNTPNGDVGLLYGRMDVENVSFEADVLTNVGLDYAFPSFSAYGKNEEDAEILVNYLVSGIDLLPGQEQRSCHGTGATFMWSDPVRLKDGSSPVNVLSDNNERWGDYTTSCRRFINGRVETWVTGCYGEGGSYGTWLGQYVNEDEFSTKTMAEFVADKTTVAKNTEITFTDLTQKNPTAWSWTFEGGVPATSTDQNPKVVFPADGSYDVTLVVQNELGKDTLTKIDFIHIQDPVALPVAEFTVDIDTIYRNDTARYTSLSSDNVVNHKWTFQAGSPMTSTLKNPVIRYNTAGSFVASLTVSNIAGSNTKTKTKYITVLNRSVPIADFSSDKTNLMAGESVTFNDLSSGGPREREWTFVGGNPSTSSLKNPVVVYNQDGLYEVSLKVTNELGENTAIKTGYIQVGQVGTNDVSLISNAKLYPNPVSNGKITLEFNTEKTQKLNFKLYDTQGKLVKILYEDRVKAGYNVFSFNAEMLTNGNYFLNISSEKGQTKTISLVVNH
jgi:PKD repeat protein